MVWTQTQRHLQLNCTHPDIANSIISEAELCESLLGQSLPDSIWDIAELMPNPNNYPSPYHHDQRMQSFQQRQQALYCGYRYSITVVNENAALAIEEWIGQSLDLEWHTGDNFQSLQTRNGIITEAQQLGSNQGMGAYRIICEPSLSQLRMNSSNRRYHHLSLNELIEDILAPYQSAANTVNVEIDDSLQDCHIQHCVQYNQTDLAFLKHYLALFGITGYFKHEAGLHTLVLVPYNHQTLRTDEAEIESILSQNIENLADNQDRLTSVIPQAVHHAHKTELYRYDNRLIDNYVGSHSVEQSSQHLTSQTKFMHSQTRMNTDDLNQLAIRLQLKQQQQANTGLIKGNIRHLSLPSSHHIEGNPFQTAPISLVSIHHRINNHLKINWLGKTPIDPTTLMPNPDSPVSSTDNSGQDQLNQQQQINDNRLEQDSDADRVHQIIALYQPHPYHHHIPFNDELEQLGQPHPSLTGLMSASIIDESSSAITTDRNHRAHIHYHWQSDSSNPSAEDTAQWLPIASHLVGDHMGQMHPLRHGQHVLVDFIGGDITQPVIVGSTHNGQGNDNAQQNRIASDTDFIDATSPVWFINPTHAHPIDGIKTQSIDSSRTGDSNKDSDINGYNQLMFDHHDKHPQLQLYSTAYQSSLTLGFPTQHTDHIRGQARGRGMSLETKAAGTLQGAKGIHITSHQTNLTSHMSHSSHGKLLTADQHQHAYDTLAETHQPVGVNVDFDSTKQKQQEDNNSYTPFVSFSEHSKDSTLQGSGQWQQPHVLIDSQRHLALLTGQHSQHTSTKSSHSHATDNTYFHSQTQLNQLAAGNIHYYSNKAQTHTAAHGDLTIQAHTDEMRLDSEQILRIHSRDSIEIIAPDTLTLKAAGSGIEISGGNVTLITPAQAGYKASKVDWGSGGGGKASVTLPCNEMEDCAAKTQGATQKGGAV